MVKKYGLRNSQLLTIPPTGSISTMIGISGGIEPIFNLSYIREKLKAYMMKMCTIKYILQLLKSIWIRKVLQMKNVYQIFCYCYEYRI